MAFTRKFLTALGLESDKVDEIINAHSEVVDGLKSELAAAQAEAEKLPGIQKELDDLKADLNTKYVAKEDHDKTVTEYQQYKDGIAAKETKAAKEKAVRAYYESKNIKGANLEIAMRGSAAEIDEIELGRDSKIKDTTALDALVGEGGTFAGLITKDAGARIDTGGYLSGSSQPSQISRGAQLYQQHYEALYGAQKGNEIK